MLIQEDIDSLESIEFTTRQETGNPLSRFDIINSKNGGTWIYNK